MGLKTNHEAIRGVRSRKGVLNGCDVSRTGANQLTMSAGLVKFGLVAADITALGGQMLNEGGAEKAATLATFDSTALADGKYVLFLKTDGTLSTTPEAETALTDGPLMAINVPGTNPLALRLDTPSVRLGQFTKAAGAIAATGAIEYTVREDA